MALTTNLTNLWQFNGNNTDLVGANVGTDTAMTYGSAYGKFNQGALFNGSSSQIALGTAITRPTNFTVAAWIKLGATGSNCTVIGDSNVANSIWWLCRISSDGTVFHGAASVAGAQEWGTTATISDTNWHFVVWQQTGFGNANTPIIYIDNVSVTVNNLYNSGTPAPTGQGTDIGEFGLVGSSQYFNGSMGQLGIWSRVLTSTEIGQLWGNNGSGLVYPFTQNNSRMFLAM